MRQPVPLLGLAGLLSVIAPAYADDDAAPVLAVEVKGARTFLTPYKDSYGRARKVREVGHGRVALGARLVRSTAAVSIDDVQVWLEGSDSAVPVPVLDGQLFVVPVNDDIARQDGNYSINKPKGAYKFIVVILPAVARGDWTMGTVREAIVDGQSAVSEIFPWYAKPFMGTVRTVSVCTREAGVPVNIMRGETVVASLPTSEKAENDIQQPVFCQHFTGTTAYQDDDRIAVPPAAEVIFL
jgi:hypothetical protein